MQEHLRKTLPLPSHRTAEHHLLSHMLRGGRASQDSPPLLL